MKVKKIVFAPAKLNIFLKILGKRKDNYHEIRSGITFINLFDKIEIEESIKTTVSYKGIFMPESGKYDDCIINKTLDFLGLKNNLQLKITINKNIPVQGGLGSASTNAAALIRGLEQMNFIEKKRPEEYASLGADVPCFLFNKDCLVTGMGEKIKYYFFPKYFFLLIKPLFNNSTKFMYDQLVFKNEILETSIITSNSEIQEEDVGNDFQNIALKENKEYGTILNYLQNLDNVIFSSMTGSGSCCYAAFDNEKDAFKAMNTFKLKFPKLSTYLCENNLINTV